MVGGGGERGACGERDRKGARGGPKFHSYDFATGNASLSSPSGEVFEEVQHVSVDRISDGESRQAPRVWETPKGYDEQEDGVA